MKSLVKLLKNNDISQLFRIFKKKSMDTHGTVTHTQLCNFTLRKQDTEQQSLKPHDCNIPNKMLCEKNVYLHSRTNVSNVSESSKKK